MQFYIRTMGCKLNRYDTAVATGLLSRYFTESNSPEKADLIVLNTCTVTHKAEREARRLVRSLSRRNPGAKVLVMGCSTRLEDSVYEKMPEVSSVVRDNVELEDFLQGLPFDLKPVNSESSPLMFTESTRAFLKIQEGCNFPCTYCIVPTVRGRSVSVPEEDVIRAFKELLENGYREIALTGVNTGEWGKDLHRGKRLHNLIESLVGLEGDFRIRLNSVEPRAVTDELISLLKNEQNLARHIQIPLQSGSKRVLKEMKRNYGPEIYSEIVSKLYDEVPGIGIGADVIAGFPTETQEDFRDTVEIIEKCQVSFLHVFSYSPRPGTPAAELPEIGHAEVAARVAELRALGKEKKEEFSTGFIGHDLSVLTLGSDDRTVRALSDNFLDVRLDREEPVNEFRKVRAVSLDSSGRVKAANDLPE